LYREEASFSYDTAPFLDERAASSQEKAALPRENVAFIDEQAALSDDRAARTAHRATFSDPRSTPIDVEASLLDERDAFFDIEDACSQQRRESHDHHAQDHPSFARVAQAAEEGAGPHHVHQGIVKAMPGNPAFPSPAPPRGQGRAIGASRGESGREVTKNGEG
jgi:hypothetical protein